LIAGKHKLRQLFDQSKAGTAIECNANCKMAH